PTVLAGLYLFLGEEVSMYYYLSGFFWMILVALLNGYLPAVSALYPDFTLGKKLAFSLAVAFTKWYWSLALVAFGAAWVYLVLLMPQLFGFVLLSVPAAVGMWVGRKALLLKGLEDKVKDEEA
ncbi:MAG: hypothetical protein LUF30_01410, partial [Lachnospiraceae bacterium]|nr:hypothetical protein [Lachnospiraceae bacterium]